MAFLPFPRGPLTGIDLQRGDSGSWVLDYARRVVGSITAIADGYAYMTSFADQAEEIAAAMEAFGDNAVAVAHPFDLLLDLAKSSSSVNPERALGHLSQALSPEILSLLGDGLQQALEGLQQALVRSYEKSQLKAQLLRQVCSHCLALRASVQDLKPGDISRARNWIQQLETVDGTDVSSSSSIRQPPRSTTGHPQPPPVPPKPPYATWAPDWMPDWLQAARRNADPSPSSSKLEPPTAGSSKPLSAPSNPPPAMATTTTTTTTMFSPPRAEVFDSNGSPYVRSAQAISGEDSEPENDELRIGPDGIEELSERLRHYDPRKEVFTSRT